MRRKPFWVVVCLLVTLVLCDRSWAQQTGENKSAVNPLVRVLQAKGILTAEEVAQINQASSTGDADQRLAKLLLMKGVISQADYDQTVGVATVMTASSTTTSNVAVIPAVYRVPVNNVPGVGAVTSASVTATHPPDQGAPASPAVIPAIAPL